MLFFTDESTGKEGLKFLDSGREQTYTCIFSSCNNPICMCRDLTIDLTPVPDKSPDSPTMSCHRVEINLDERKQCPPEKEFPPGEKAFGDLLLSKMRNDDFSFLANKLFAYKNKITQTTDLRDIEVDFDYDEIEQNGLMYAYNTVLPYGDMLDVTLRGKQYMICDQFCLLPKCKCTDTNLEFFLLEKDPVPQATGAINSVFSVHLTYAKKQWTEIKEFPSFIPLKELQSAIEKQFPDFYRQLRVRHEKLKTIYSNCRKKNYLPSPAIRSGNVGRNDPCPCGSGKKYKR